MLDIALLNDLLDEDVIEDLDLGLISKHTLEELSVVIGTWGQSRASGSSGFRAYLLANGYWLIRQEWTTDDWEYLGLVPKGDEEEAFPSLVEEWFDREEVMNTGPPSELNAEYDDQPWFIQLAMDAFAWRIGEILDYIEDHQLAFGSPSDLEPEDVQAIWDNAVTVDPDPGNGPIPGIADWSESSEPFRNWLKTVRVRWKDTGEELVDTDAEDLRVTCLYLCMV